MTSYKVYIRHNHKADVVYVEANSVEQVKWKVLSRFYNASINKIVEITWKSANA